MATLEARLDELIDELGLDYKTFATWLFGSPLGSLAQLNTTDKSSFAAAINETRAAASGAPSPATEGAAGIVTLASLLDMASGVGNKVATVGGVRQEREALKNEILGGVGPMADTLQELYALAQGAEETTAINDLVTIVNSKANSADVYSKVQIDAMLGNPDRDLVAAYNAAKA